MADAYLLEAGVDRYLLEDGSGVILLETEAAAEPVPYSPWAQLGPILAQ